MRHCAGGGGVLGVILRSKFAARSTRNTLDAIHGNRIKLALFAATERDHHCFGHLERGIQLHQHVLVGILALQLDQDVLCGVTEEFCCFEFDGIIFVVGLFVVVLLRFLIDGPDLCEIGFHVF